MRKGKMFNSERMEPTMVAAYNGRLDALQCLASYGADVKGQTLMVRLLPFPMSHYFNSRYESIKKSLQI